MYHLKLNQTNKKRPLWNGIIWDEITLFPVVSSIQLSADPEH